MRTLSLILFVIFLTFLSAQDQIRLNTNTIYLEELSRQLSDQYDRDHAQALEAAIRNGWPVYKEFEDGTTIELQYLHNGFPVYYTTHNWAAAETISTNKVYPGGSAGLDLTGGGIVLYEWDAGAVLLTHQELVGRVTIGDPATNTTTHDHSTHVAGTMMAAGVDGGAKGMSYQASLIDYDWDSDTSEMATAGTSGALITNHSYGLIRGWQYNYFGDGLWAWFGDPAISQQEDCYFGFYRSESATWDDIAFNAPYMLIFKSAGNDRDDDGPTAGSLHWAYNWGTSTWYQTNQIRNPDGNYDCIGVKGIAKNIMTVGAVDDILGGYTGTGDITQIGTDFSSWGPADDGRIKPDIVANGEHLYSCIDTGDDLYAYKWGTSMSSPSAAGSAGLLQEHYHDLYGEYMRASTLKALIIHTADEAGPNPGPDYMHGWGLMNTETAAGIIGDKDELSLILEETLSNGETYSIDVSALGTEPLVATLCWHDPPGTPVAPALDPSTPMLVNDLDMVITRNSTTTYPWKLNRSNPSAAATRTGENNVDNVEKIEISSPVADIYTLTISHDGTLGSPQVFSLIVTGIAAYPPEIEVTPTSIDVLLGEGAVTDEILQITNNGFRDLIFNCNIQYLTRDSTPPDNTSDRIEIELIPDQELIPGYEISDPVRIESSIMNRDDVEIYHDNGTLWGGIGANSGFWWTCAARFTPDELASYYGEYALKTIKFMLHGDIITTLTVKVWRGGTFANPGTELYSVDISPPYIVDDWTFHELSSPIPLIGDDEYWIGYYVLTPALSYPSKCDTGPMVAGKGGWFKWGDGSWIQLIDYALDHNWMIRGIISEQWLSITANGSGTVPGSMRDFINTTVHFDAGLFPDGTVKTANIIVESNDPYNPEVVIPVTMTISATQPDPPANLVITRSGNNIILNWESVPGAVSYNIYSDLDPYGSFTTLEASGVAGTTWSDTNPAGVKKFYIIKANN